MSLPARTALATAIGLGLTAAAALAQDATPPQPGAEDVLVRGHRPSSDLSSSKFTAPIIDTPKSITVSSTIDYARCPKRFYWSVVRPLPRFSGPAARIGTEIGGYASGQPLCGDIEIFEHTAPGPIDIGAILEDHIDEGYAEEREAPHHARARDAEHRRRQREGHLVLDDLRPGKHLYLLSTGTGLAPFMSVIQDPQTYERFEKVILVHGVRYVSEVAYEDFITQQLPENEYFGDAVREKLIYYPTVTREPFRNQGRLTDLMRSGKLFADIGLPPINPQDDRAMICGSPSMLDETSQVLDSFGLQVSPRMGEPGDYLIERAFVEK